MLDSPLFQVIIGLVFVYSLLSILVTQVNAVITSFLKLRPKHLRDGLNDLIQDQMMRAKIMTHPLIMLVKDKVVLPGQRLTDEQAVAILDGELNPVNRIDPKTFVNVLMNVVRVESDKELFNALLDVVDSMPSNADRRRLRSAIVKVVDSGDGLAELRETIAAVQDATYREALTQAFDEINSLVGRLGLENNSVISLIAGLRSIKNPYFRKVMQTVLSTSRTLDEAEQQLTLWFNDGMSRVSDAFSRYMGLLSLGVGLLLAVVLNADTLQLARALWTDPVLRSTVVTAAQAQQQQPIYVSTFRPTNAQTEAQTTDDVLTEINNNLGAAQATAEQLISLNLPLGWQWEDVRALPVDDPAIDSRYGNSNNLWNYIPGNSPYWLTLWLTKLVGLALTMVAIAQGAPFWFNILNRIARGQGVSLGR